MCAVSRSYVTWLLWCHSRCPSRHAAGNRLLYVCYASYTCVVTRTYVIWLPCCHGRCQSQTSTRNRSLCASWLVHMCAMTHPYVCHGWSIKRILFAKRNRGSNQNLNEAIRSGKTWIFTKKTKIRNQNVYEAGRPKLIKIQIHLKLQSGCSRSGQTWNPTKYIEVAKSKKNWRG